MMMNNLELPENILYVPSEKYMEMFNLDVSDYLDYKGKFAYVSWSWAWVLLKKHFPSFVPTYVPSPEGLCYWIDPHTKEAYIKPVIIDVETKAVSLPFDYPVMDFKNKAVKVLEDIPILDAEGKETAYFTKTIPNSLDRMLVEKNVLRAMVKAIAKVTGIGIRLWNDEDIEGDKRSGYLDRLDTLFKGYEALTKETHPQRNSVFTMTNKELLLLGKALKEEVEKLNIKTTKKVQQEYPE